MNSRLPARSLALLFAAALPLSAWASSATEPAPRPDEWWQKRHATMNTNVATLGDKAMVIFVGDSITQGWEGEGNEVWAQYYAPRNAINLGIGGDRTQHVLWRLENGNLKGLKPKAAVVMIGTNNSNGEDNTVEQIAEGVTAIITKLRASLPDTKILLLGIFPRGENPNPQRGKVLQVNQILQKLDDGQSVFYLDFGSKFVTADGLIPRDLMPDYLHLSPKAYGIWADSIEPKLSTVLGDSAVKGGAATTAGGLTGEWTFTIPGPDGQPVSFPMVLQQDGAKLTGKFARPDGKWLELENGKVTGSDLSWTVKRDRPGGGVMTYQMSGKLEGGKIAGKAKTEMDGNAIESDWSAKRN